MFQRGVEAFLAVVRCKTLKAAAGRLNLAQSTVSKRLQQLEEECGIILFERSKGSKEARLTPEGEHFAGVAERMLDLFAEARSFQPTLKRHSLTIGAVHSMFAVFMPRLCVRLLEQEPQLRIGALTMYSSEMYEAIDVRRIDVGFCLLERTYPGVNRERCYAEPIVGVRRVAGEAVHGESVHLESLDPEQEICFVWTPLRYQNWHDERVHGEFARMLVDDPGILFRILRSTGQWALVPLSVAREYCLRPGYQIFRPRPEPPDRVCYRLTHTTPRTEAAAALAQFWAHADAVLREEFGPDCNGRGTALFRAWLEAGI